MRGAAPRLVLLAAAAVAYELLRPGVWPWLLLLAVPAALAWLLYRRPPRLVLERELGHSRAFPGESLPVRLTVRLRAPLPLLLSIEESAPRTVIPDRPAALSGLVWGERRLEFEYVVTPNSRGVYAWPPARVSWSDPLGLFQHSARLGGDGGSELLVYPHSHGLVLPDLATPVLAEGPTARRRALEDPASVAGAREYVPGDPPRRIHWRQTAQHGVLPDGRFARLIVREFESVAATGVVVHLDLDASGRGGALYLESAARLAASVLREAHDSGLPVGASTALTSSPMGGGFAAYERALAMLATVSLESGAGHDLPLPPPGTNLVVVTMRAPNALVDGALRARARAARVTVVALPEGFYLEPGEGPRPLFVAPPESVRELAARAAVLEEAGVRVLVLRGDESVLRLAAR